MHLIRDFRYAFRGLIRSPLFTGVALMSVLVLVGSGLALGLAASWGLGRYVGSQLYGVTGNHPATIAGACLLLAAVAAVAGYLPARRATRVNPVLALQYE